MLSGVGDSVGTATEKVGGTVSTVAGKVKVPALVGTAAAAGIAGGVLGSRALSRNKTTSKVPLANMRGALPNMRGALPNMRGGMLKSVAHEVQEVGKEIGKAGFRLGVGDVSMEVQSGKNRKESRDSPLEVLLKGLTQRRSHR
jgi:hypothetical protein